MPQPVGSSQRYMPGLDGLRAIAVIAVIAFHLGFKWAPGGLLGVGVFFTLSGYLITDLLLAQWARTGIHIGDFWLRRARRLLPALFLMLAVVVVWVAAVGPAQPAEFKDAVGAAALYVSNWQQVFQHVSYFARFGPPSPLQHLWSLAVEEQFYIVWPLLLMLCARLVYGSASAAALKPRIACVTLLLAGASSLAMALLYQPQLDPSRVYYGTDTRACELLFGAALAMVWPSRMLRASIAPSARRLLDGLGLAGLAGIVAMVCTTGEHSAFLYEGGFVVLSCASVLLIAALVHPGCRLGDVLGCRPLRWIGVRSYGIYLWHFPIIVLSTPAGDYHPSLLRDACEVAATVLVAALSWRFVEEPIRHRALARAWAKLRATGWRPRSIPRSAWSRLAGALLLLGLTCAGLAGVSFAPRGEASLTRSALSGAVARSVSVRPGASRRHGAGHNSGVGGGGTAGQAGGASGAGRGAGQAAPSAGDDGERLRGAGGAGTGRARATGPGGAAGSDSAATQVRHTFCKAVVDIGDSTSEGLISPDYLPNPATRIEARYAQIGVSTERFEISGARSIVETYEGQPNGYEVAQRWKRSGYHGCWVIALGTNDTADVDVGSNVGRTARIARMMSLLGNEPVLWVNVKSLLDSGPYAEQNMQLWDEALARSCRRYTTMRVFDWAALAKNAWFIDDGIHYNTPGYEARSRLIAEGLANAFPATGQTEGDGCAVR